MTNDSKLGLLAGLAAVVVVAVVYFQKPPDAGAAVALPPKPAAVSVAPAVIVNIPAR